ncbi:hypothetical protein VTJ49DRAFT_5388 [Mycothermus thermophilus]|uniref:SnoaL-like domain-containing protein n=1 Tax=Humicola insolens TaxID=85995 RepID=A0ABR3V3C8_HUMIN
MTSSVDPHTKVYSHLNGTVGELLDRLAVAELCKGWAVYRDSSEWNNYRSLFTDDATVWTIDRFISLSKAGKENGVFIMHRECGTLVELNPATRRAIGKMKATITHRFQFNPTTSTLDPDQSRNTAEFDVDCDCRFIFFCEKSPETGHWKAKYVKLFYEKDKVVPVDGITAPTFTDEELASIPRGYKYLGAAQARLGYRVDVDLPTAGGKLFERMYGEMEKWLDGQEVDLFWEKVEKKQEA